MLMNVPTRPRSRRLKYSPARSANGPFELVSAEYSEGSTITLTFSSAINIDALDGSQISVDDGEGTGSIWQGAGEVELIDTQTISIGLTEFSASMSTAVYLNATASNGIVASDGSGAWVGTTSLPLPYPG